MNTQKEMNYYLLQGMKNNAFYMLHKFLFEEDFIELSNNSKILYTLIKDRMSLSVLNKWHDNNGKVYCYFTNEDIKKFLNVSGKTATKAKNELIDRGLLEEERQYDKPTRYYLKKPAESIANTKTSNNYGTEIVETTAPKTENVPPSKTELNDTDINKNNILHVSNETRACTIFDNLKDADVIKQINNIISENRNKITTDNYEKSKYIIDEIIEEHGIDTLNDMIKWYMKEKEGGRSIENFIMYKDRFLLNEVV